MSYRAFTIGKGSVRRLQSYGVINEDIDVLITPQLLSTIYNLTNGKVYYDVARNRLDYVSEYFREDDVVTSVLTNAAVSKLEKQVAAGQQIGKSITLDVAEVDVNKMSELLENVKKEKRLQRQRNMLENVTARETSDVICRYVSKEECEILNNIVNKIETEVLDKETLESLLNEVKKIVEVYKKEKRTKDLEDSVKSLERDKEELKKEKEKLKRENEILRRIVTKYVDEKKMPTVPDEEEIEEVELYKEIIEESD